MNSSSATHSDRAFMAALALNNMAVSLLERNCHQAAMRIFRDAIDILKNHVSDDSKTSAHTPQCTLDTYAFEAQLERAKHELAYALPESHKRLNFCVLSEEECFAVVSSAVRNDMAASMMNPFDTNYLIRIEMRGRSIRDCRNNVDFESSIILNNFGICFSCCAQNGTSTIEDSFARMCSAYQLFELAHFSLLQSENREYALSILLLANLAGLAFVLEMECAAKAHFEDLLEQQEYLLTMGKFSGKASCMAAAAA